MNTENTTERRGEHWVITDVGDVLYGGKYETFKDAVEAMMTKWNQLTIQEQVSIAKRDYCNELGGDYMVVVGFYDEETGEAEECISLAEVIEAMEEEEEEEEEEGDI